MKILVVTGGYLPAQKYGGPVTSIMNFVSQLGDEYEIEIVTRNHDLHEKKPFDGILPGFNPVGKAKVLYLPDSELGFKAFNRIIAERKPDCLYLSSIFDYALNLPLLRIAKKKNIPVIYAPRGELDPNVLAIKALKKKIFLFMMRLLGVYNGVYFQATNESEKEYVCSALNVPSDMVFVLPNLSALPIERGHIQKESGKLSVVFISRIHCKKNLLYAVERLMTLKGEISFDIYGPIEDADYWQTCRNLMQKLPTNVSAVYKGTVKVGEAIQTFAKYDCFLFPTVSENYSQAIAESVLAGTPVVISRGTTPWDDVNQNGGFAVELDNPDGFTQALQFLCDANTKEYTEICFKLKQYCKEKLNYDKLCLQYKEMFNYVIDSNKDER